MNTALPFLSAMKQISPTEYAGPCPFCGGTDRFKFWTDNERGSGQGGRFWCRQCLKSGDGVQLVRELEGVGYREALEMLGIETGASSFAKRTPYRKCTPNCTQPVEPDAGVDATKWRKVAADFLTHCQRDLMPGAVPSAGAIENLITKRHISPATAIALGLAYYNDNKYVPAEAWGIDASTTNSGKIRVPGPGVVIASKRQAQVFGLYVHFDKPEQYQNGSPCKGRVVRGSAKDAPFIAGLPGVPIFIVESALDAALLWQEGRGRISAIGMNGGRKPVDEDCMQFIRQAPFLVLCGDRDSNKAGDSAMHAWRSLFSFAVPCKEQYAVDAKDVGEMHDKAMLDDTIPTAEAFISIVIDGIQRDF